MNISANNETERLAALLSYKVLDTPPETGFDDLALLASQLCQTPIAAISFVDSNRQWFKSQVGLSTNEYPRKNSFCAQTVMSADGVLEVSDTRVDKRFANKALVSNPSAILFYAGIPLVTDQGFAMGTLCLMDFKPKKLSETQKLGLQALARQVMSLLELRKYKNSQPYYEHLTQDSEVTYKDLVENANDLIQVSDSLGRLLYVNNAWCDTLGYQKDEITHLALEDILHPNSLNHYLLHLQQLPKQKEYSVLEAVLKTKDDKKVYIEGRIAFDTKDNKLMSTRAIFRDITQRRQADKERDHLFNYSLDLCCIVGFDGYFKQLNPAWEKTLGWSSAELLSTPYMDFIHPADHESTIKAVATVKDGNNLLLSENRYLCKDGSYRWFSWFAYPEAEEELFFAVARDIVTDNNDKAIVSTIIAMAHSMGLDVIAEGVETKQQQQFLVDNGCINFQGYLFAKPLPIALFEKRLKAK